MTLQNVLRRGRQRLIEAGITEPELNAWYLFAHCFAMNRTAFFLRGNERAEEETVQRYYRLLDIRCNHVPLEYITHETEFMGLPFYIDENVLIPRQDTECLAELVLEECKGKDVLDLCTGSGCIGISLAVLGNCRSVTLADVSGEALAVAQKNAEKNHAEVRLVESNLFSEIEDTYDVIVSNPPYIASDVIESLEPEVKDYEPRLALDGSADGLAFYRRIIEESRRFLRRGGQLAFEIGYDQGESVCHMMEAAGFTEVERKKDLAGLDRIVRGWNGGKNV